MAIEEAAGVEPGKLLLHIRIQPLAGAAGGVAALILGPEPMQHEPQLAGALLPIPWLDGAMLGRPGECHGVIVKLPRMALALGGGDPQQRPHQPYHDLLHLSFPLISLHPVAPHFAPSCSHNRESKNNRSKWPYSLWVRPVKGFPCRIRGVSWLSGGPS